MGLLRRTQPGPASAHAAPPTSLVPWLALSLLIAAHSHAWAQSAPAAATPTARDWTFRPVFTLGIGYDSNITYTPGQAPGDYFGGFGVRAPLTGKLSRNASLTASYSANGEWYRELDVFDAFPSRQDASLAWSYSSGEAWNAGLRASYSESRRPEDLFPETGVGYLRGKARNLGAGASFGRRLGLQTRLDLGYNYGRPFYETLDLDRFQQRADSHGASASLGRNLSRTSILALRYQYQLYLREGIPNDESNVVGLGYTTALGRNATLSLFAGARFQAGEVRPDLSASLGRSWRSSQLSLSYTKTRNYVPTTADFTETDSATLSWSYGRRRFQFALGAGYSRNRLEERAGDIALGRDFESWRGGVNTVYMLSRWLGLGATYQYNWQKSGDSRFDDRTRHLAQAGLTVSPWNERQPQGLR